MAQGRPRQEWRAEKTSRTRRSPRRGPDTVIQERVWEGTQQGGRGPGPAVGDSGWPVPEAGAGRRGQEAQGAGRSETLSPHSPLQGATLSGLFFSREEQRSRAGMPAGDWGEAFAPGT